MYHVATGGVLLKVPDTMAHDARIILSQTWSVTAAQLGIEDDDDDEEVGDHHLTEFSVGPCSIRRRSFTTSSSSSLSVCPVYCWLTTCYVTHAKPLV